MELAVGGAEGVLPADGEVFDVQDEFAVAGFVVVGVVELGGYDGGGDLMGVGVVPEAVEVEVVGEAVGPHGDSGASVGSGGVVEVGLGHASCVVVEADAEVVGGGAAGDGPAEGEAGAVEVDAGGLEDLEGAFGEV